MELALRRGSGNLKAANTAAEGVLEAMRKGGPLQPERAADGGALRTGIP